jgi:hypothetical protein
MISVDRASDPETSGSLCRFSHYPAGGEWYATRILQRLAEENKEQDARGGFGCVPVLAPYAEDGDIVGVIRIPGIARHRRRVVVRATGTAT